MFEYIHLTQIDLCILASSFCCSFAIGYTDWKHQQFSFFVWLLFLVSGVAWCFVQTFIPLALIPLSIGMCIVGSINRWFMPIIGNGDILLFLTAGLFVPIIELGTFLTLCGMTGLITFWIRERRGFPVKYTRIPLAPSILIAMWLTLFIYGT